MNTFNGVICGKNEFDGSYVICASIGCIIFRLTEGELPIGSVVNGVVMGKLVSISLKDAEVSYQGTLESIYPRCFDRQEKTAKYRAV